MVNRSGYAIFIGVILCLGFSEAYGAESLHEAHRGVIYAERETAKLATDVYVPRGQGRFPGVLVVHGGAWMSGERSHLGGIAKQLADHGYTAMTISYRLAPQHKFPAQLEDCRDAVLWMMHQALLAVGVSTELYVVEKKSHFGAIRDKQAALKALEFLNSVLKNPKLPSPQSQSTTGPSQRPARRPSPEVP